MATRSPTEHHSTWTPVSAANLLPNASGAPLAAEGFFLEAGDTCYVTTGSLYVCLDPGSPSVGDAVWSALARPVAAMFFALMPPDNAATVAIGAAVEFPQDGATIGGGEAPVRVGPASFQIQKAGVYQISYQASVDEAGQLAMAVNGTPVSATRAGRATGTSQISNTFMFEFAFADIIEIWNSDSAGALTITPNAGGASAVSAVLTIALIG